MNTKFKLGDRVKAKDEYEGNDNIIGQVGTVISIEVRRYAENIYLVEFDKDIGGHTGNHNESTRDGHCWHIPDWNLYLIKAKSKEIKIYGLAKFCMEHYK